MRPDWIKRQIVWPDPTPSSNRRSAVLLTNCTGRGIAPYLLENPQFRKHFNLTCIETGPIRQAEGDGIEVVDSPEFNMLFGAADLVITNDMGARHGNLALASLSQKFSSKTALITFVAPNCGVFWPWAYGYGGTLGILQMLDKGASREDVWETFKNGSFDPCFNLRWRLELGRLHDKAAYHDIDIALFIQKYYKKVKLFMAQSHPSFHIIAHIGDSICKLLGMKTTSEEENIAGDHTRLAIGGQPETQYEFSHFALEYPIRYTDKVDWYYGLLLDQAIDDWKTGAIIRPGVD